MNRRNFLKLIGVAVVSPSLPVGRETFTMVGYGSPVAAPATIRCYAELMNGMLKELYIPALAETVFGQPATMKMLWRDNAPVIEFLSFEQVYKETE